MSFLSVGAKLAGMGMRQQVTGRMLGGPLPGMGRKPIPGGYRGQRGEGRIGAPGPIGQLRSFVENKAFNVNAALDMVERLSNKVSGSLPQFAHSISVTAAGGPQADLRRVWYLCLAAAFGRLRNRVRGIQQTEMECVWDVTDKVCTVTIGYVNNGMIGAGNALTGGPLSSPVGLIQRGPDQVTVGGSWPMWLRALTVKGAIQSGVLNITGGSVHKTAVVGPNGIYLLQNKAMVQVGSPDVQAAAAWPPVYETEDTTTPELLYKSVQDFGSMKSLFVESPVSTGSRGAQFLPWSRTLPLKTVFTGRFGSTQKDSSQLPTLPDDGRVITTGQKLHPLVQNPRPPIDGKTRVSFVQLVAQSLARPGFLPTTPPAGYLPLAAPGVFVYHPGQGLEDEQLNNGRFTGALQAIEQDLDQTAVVNTTQAPITPDGFGVDGYRVPKGVPNVRD